VGFIGRLRILFRTIFWRGTLRRKTKLFSATPKGKYVITESGILTREDVTAMNEQGVYGFLVGESFMRASGGKLRALFF
jgi:indole-3-glycerol phosphate synthase